MRSLLPVLLLLLAACRTPRQFPADERAQERDLEFQQRIEQQRQLEEERERTRLLIDDTEAQLADIRRETQGLRSELDARATNRDLQNVEKRIDALETRLERLDQQRAQDREDIIETLSQRMTEVMAARPSSSGRTHTVARGETLSAIAAAYRVNSRAIIQANNLSNPDNLRVGQELVIPGD